MEIIIVNEQLIKSFDFTYYKEDGRYRLQPENDALEPIIVDKVQILGVMVGLIRMM